MRRERDNKSCQENPETNIWGLRRGKGGLGSGKDIDEVKRGRIIFQMNFFSWIRISWRRQFKSTDAKQLLVIVK